MLGLPVGGWERRERERQEQGPEASSCAEGAVRRTPSGAPESPIGDRGPRDRAGEDQAARASPVPSGPD